MMLSERIAEEVKAAQKSGNGERLGVLRFISAQLQNRAIEKRGTGQSPQLTDADVRESLQKEAKKRREAAELFRKGGRARSSKASWASVHGQGSRYPAA